MRTIDGKQIPESLDEFLVPSRTAHVSIDLQNDCCHADGSLARAGADVSRYPGVVDVVASFAEETRRLGVLQVFVKLLTLPNGRSDSPAWIRLRQRLSTQYGGEAVSSVALEYCLSGTWGAELMEPLAALDGDVVVEKHRSSAFFGTNLDMVLRSNGIESLIFTGCTTEGCVESTVRDAGFLDYFPVVLRDGVASDVPELHAASLYVMDAYRADVVDSATALAALRRAS